MKKTEKKNLDLVGKTINELKALLKKTQLEWQRLKIDLHLGKLKDIKSPKKKAKEIARIKTIIRVKELEQEKNSHEKI